MRLGSSLSVVDPVHTGFCAGLGVLDDIVLDSSLSVIEVGLNAKGALSMAGLEIVGSVMSGRVSSQVGSTLSSFSNAYIGETMSTVCISVAGSSTVGRSVSLNLWVRLGSIFAVESARVSGSLSVSDRLRVGSAISSGADASISGSMSSGASVPVAQIGKNGIGQPTGPATSCEFRSEESGDSQRIYQTIARSTRSCARRSRTSCTKTG